MSRAAKDDAVLPRAGEVDRREAARRRGRLRLLRRAAAPPGRSAATLPLRGGTSSIGLYLLNRRSTCL
jgi:hypothetical protein